MPEVGPCQCLWEAAAQLGEGAVWSETEQALYWVDILGKRLHRWTPASAARAQWTFQEEISALAPRAGGAQWVLALRRGLAVWNPQQPTEPPRYLCELEPHLPGNRCNDGKCDAQGRFWVGTIDFDCARPTGALYRLDHDGQVHRFEANMVVINGPAWSADQTTLLLNDTVNGRILAYTMDPASGALSGARVWLQLAPGDGLPDGLCTDAAGRIWLCHWGGGCVSCHDPLSARELGRITLPVSQVTSCAFGGADLRTLYVTTARTGLTAQALAREPLAGALFAVTVGAPGCLPHAFAG